MKKITIFLGFLFFAVAGYASENIVAKVNGAVITTRDVEIEVDRLIPSSTYHGTISDDRRDEFRKKAIENLIDRELQYQDAVARGLKPDKNQVKVRMRQIRDRFNSEKEYKAALEQAGITEDGLRANIEREVLVQAVIDETVKKPAQFSEDQLREYYNQNVDKFKQPESVRLRIISSKNEKKAREILARLKAGDDFGSLAATMSEDMYRIKGGDIGYIHRGRIIPVVEKEAFSLKKGDIADRPIKADDTWYIIKVEDRVSEKQLSFDEIKVKLKKELEAKREQELMEKWMSGLRSKAKIEKSGE